MAIEPKLILADIYHKRFFPKINIFHYKSYYLLLPLSLINQTSDLTKSAKKIFSSRPTLSIIGSPAPDLVTKLMNSGFP